MANVNIVTVSTINGLTTAVALSTTSETSVLSNAAASNTVYKIESLVVSNNSASAATITINYHSAAALGGTTYPICSTTSVPAYASLVVIEKTNGIYLEQNSSLGATAGTSNVLNVVCSYEAIS